MPKLCRILISKASILKLAIPSIVSYNFWLGCLAEASHRLTEWTESDFYGFLSWIQNLDGGEAISFFVGMRMRPPWVPESVTTLPSFHSLMTVQQK